MTGDTVFDMASLTKPIATATSVMILIEQGKLRLDDTVVALLARVRRQRQGGDHRRAPAPHTSGLIADNPIEDYADGREKACERICNAQAHRPGRARSSSTATSASSSWASWSSRVSGHAAGRVRRESVFEPLGMTDTGFRPTGVAPRNCAHRRRSATDTGCAARSTTRGRTRSAASPATPGCSARPTTWPSTPG